MATTCGGWAVTCPAYSGEGSSEGIKVKVESAGKNTVVVDGFYSCILTLSPPIFQNRFN